MDSDASTEVMNHASQFVLNHLSSSEVVMEIVNRILKTKLRIRMNNEIYMQCLIILMDL